LKDLRERFAKVEIQASKPIVPFRETAVRATGVSSFDICQNFIKTSLEMAPIKTPNALRGTMRGSSANKVVTFTIRALPVPTTILDFILENIMVLRTLIHDKGDQQVEEEEQDVDLHGDVIRKSTISPDQFWDVFAEKCKEVAGEWEGVAARTWAFGPQKAGGCLLIDARNRTTIASFVFFFPKVTPY
jgi:ribosome assembly protein 1